jgi:hypothetical protein
MLEQYHGGLTTPASGFFLRHLRNVEMSHVEIANTVPD